MRKFQSGDKVEVIDEDLSGTVAFAKADLITITTEEGFSFQFPPNSLVHQKELKIGEIQISEAEVDFNTRKRSVSSSRKNEIVVDLHIHEIVDHDAYLPKHQKLSIQLKEAKNKLAEAKNNRISKVVFIHGVGKGVLKEELHKFLEARTGLEFYDADYALYGRGATEVKLYHFK